MGSFTVGNAHFEMVIPGTADHQVLTWELAEQLVTFDMARTGLLGAAPASTGFINASPSHRTIPSIIYNGLPVELCALIGGPLDNVSADVGIPTDGQATRFVLAGQAAEAATRSEQEFVIEYDQVIPKPFCANGATDFLYVKGPVSLKQAVFTIGGELRQVFRAEGELVAVPIDVLTGQPSGEAMRARVSEDQASRAGDQGGRILGTQLQQLLPASAPGAGQRKIHVNVAIGKAPHYDANVICH